MTEEEEMRLRTSWTLAVLVIGALVITVTFLFIDSLEVSWNAGVRLVS